MQKKDLSAVKVLDCTFRDGGYYTDWQFTDEAVRDAVIASANAGANYIEIGYKSPNEGGEYKTCKEEKIKSLDLDLKDSILGFMIDLKEFVKSDMSLDHEVVDRVIPDAKNSEFGLCRIATHVNKLDATIDAIGHIKNKGYQVIVNIMGVSLLSEEECSTAAERFFGQPIEALYFADSLGNLSMYRTRQIAEILLQKSGLAVGFHAHENQGLSLGNALAALGAGVTFVDGTIYGMGRGAGNVRLEQLLLCLNSQGRQYNPEALIGVIDKHFLPLHAQYNWGWSYDYMLTGQRDIHPMYAQSLNKDYDLTLEQKNDIIGALEFTEHSPSSKYDTDVLTKAIETSGSLNLKPVVVIPARYESSRFPGKPLVSILGIPMIIRVCRIAERAVGSGNVYVATDSHKIGKVVKEYGFEYIITHQASTGTDRIAEAIAKIDADIFINVQGDEPVLNPQDILDIIEQKKISMHEVINGMCPLSKEDNKESINIPKVVASEDGKLIYMSRKAVPGWKSFNKQLQRTYWKQVCIYAFTRDELELFATAPRGSVESSEDIEILRFLEIGYPVRMVKTSGNSAAVDVPEDIITVERILNANVGQ